MLLSNHIAAQAKARKRSKEALARAEKYNEKAEPPKADPKKVKK